MSALQTLKKAGKIVSGTGKWSFWGGVLMAAVSIAILASPAGPAVLGGAAIALTVGTIMAYTGAGAYLLGKLPYPVTRIFASMKHGPKAFFTELARQAARGVTTVLKAGGAALLGTAVIMTGGAITGGAIGLTALGALAPGVGASLAASIAVTSVVGAAGMLIGKLGDRLARHIKPRWGRGQRKAVEATSGGGKRKAPEEKSPDLSSRKRLFKRSKEEIEPKIIHFNELTDQQRQDLKSKTFIVESVDNNSAVIHKDTNRCKEKYICINGVDCPSDLQPNQKMKLAADEHGKLKFESAPVKKRSESQTRLIG
ncbi:MAG: hypothetical protein V4568_11710 [Pseudomonadota bacterium]